MRLFDDHPERDKYLVFLDGKYMTGIVAADDEEGWVDVLDPSALAKFPFPPIKKDSDVPVMGEEISEWEEIPTTRKEGKVVFVKLPS